MQLTNWIQNGELTQQAEDVALDWAMLDDDADLEAAKAATKAKLTGLSDEDIRAVLTALETFSNAALASLVLA